MDAIYPCVAGLDVHKQTVVACVRRLDGRGRVSKQVRTFGTMTRDLLELGDWLSRQGVTHVAMESTGVSETPCAPKVSCGPKSDPPIIQNCLRNDDRAGLHPRGRNGLVS